MHSSSKGQQQGLQEFLSRRVSKILNTAVSAHLDVTPLRVEQYMGVGHQQSRVHEGFHWQLCMQPEPLLYLTRQQADVS